MDLEKAEKKIQKEKRINDLMDVTLDQLKYEAQSLSSSMDEELQSIEESWREYQKRYLDSTDIIDPKVTPVGQMIVTTAMLMNAYEQKAKLTNAAFDINMVEQLKSSISDEQIVVAAGKFCKEVKPGDKVKINLANFFRVQNPNSVNRQEVFELPLEDINGRNYVVMHERDVKYIINH